MPPSVALTNPDEAAQDGFALLAACARPELNQQNAHEIKALVRAGIDWGTLLPRALRHGMMPLVYWHLHTTCPEAIPQTVLNALRDYFLANAKRTLFLTREMHRLLRLLATHAIPVIVLKGPLLGWMVYGNPSLRPFADLDILVHKEDLPKLKRVLGDEGYLPESEMFHVPTRALINCADERTLRHAPTGIELDVHWRLFPRRLSYARDCDELWERAQCWPLKGQPWPTISREDLLLFLCRHGSKHLWERLGWICDVAMLISTPPQFDWAEIFEQAHKQRCSRMLFLGLALARDVLGTELSNEASEKIRADCASGALAAQVREWLAHDTTRSVGRWERHAFYLHMTERVADKARYLLRLAIIPTMDESRLSRWSETPAWFYYVIRPLHLLTRYGVKVLGVRFR